MSEQGYEAIHTLDLPDQNKTPDAEIIRITAEDAVSVVISKDKDFPEQRIIRGLPERLLWITTGNIRNDALIELFEKVFGDIDNLFQEGAGFVELSNESITVHD